MSDEWASLQNANNLATVKRWDDALAELEPAMASDELSGEANCIAARCYLGLERPKEAIAAAERAAAFDPDDEEPHMLLSIAYQRCNRHLRARQHAEEAVRLAPDSVGALHLLAIAQLNRFRRRRAQRAAELSVAANPHHPLAHLTLGTVARRRWRLGRAERAFRDGLRLKPDDADLSLGLATTLHQKGRTKEAAQAYLAAAHANPTDGRARRGLARLGLPLLTFGILGKLATRDGAVTLTHHVHNLVALTAIALGGIAAVGAITTYLHVRAARRSLPHHVYSALGPDHRDFALGWVALAGVFALVMGLYADGQDAGVQRDPDLAYALFAFGAIAVVLARQRIFRVARNTARGYARILRPWR
jgi:tetratricopeptide (TPR) repeat protein